MFPKKKFEMQIENNKNFLLKISLKFNKFEYDYVIRNYGYVLFDMYY